MRKTMLSAAVVLAISVTACNPKNDSQVETQQVDTIANKTSGHMSNLISIVEIPSADFARARTFYQSILGIQIEEAEMDGIRMGLFPNADEGVFVQLIHGSDYNPSGDGTVVYLNGGKDLQTVADKIEANGGRIVVPKTEIGPGMGFFAIFIDTEGNKLGLHSAN